MKRFATLIALCMLAIPTAVLAQSPPPMPPPPGMSPEMASRMRQMREQMEKIHRTERAQVLAALSPAHRALLASLVGGLAVAANPDPKAAAAKLDAALSPGEKSAVQKIHDATHAQMRNMMKQMAQNRPQGAQKAQFREMPQRHKPSAGQLVLEIAGSGMHPHNMFFMGGPGMRRFHGHGHPKMSPPPGAPAPANT
jgi:hypothetical protein